MALLHINLTNTYSNNKLQEDYGISNLTHFKAFHVVALTT